MAAEQLVSPLLVTVGEVLAGTAMAAAAALVMKENLSARKARRHTEQTEKENLQKNPSRRGRL